MENKKTSKKSMKAAEMPAAPVVVSKAPKAASKPMETVAMKSPAKPSAPRTTVHRHSKVAAASGASISYDEVARLAYKYWEERHHADGFAEEDWHRAEKAVGAR